MLRILESCFLLELVVVIVVFDCGICFIVVEIVDNNRVISMRVEIVSRDVDGVNMVFVIVIKSLDLKKFFFV